MIFNTNIRFHINWLHIKFENLIAIFRYNKKPNKTVAALACNCDNNFFHLHLLLLILGFKL